MALCMCRKKKASIYIKTETKEICLKLSVLKFKYDSIFLDFFKIMKKTIYKILQFWAIFLGKLWCEIF